ncbi:MAG: alpha/beta fold hydrolase [Candidatus Binatia bacterium]
MTALRFVRAIGLALLGSARVAIAIPEGPSPGTAEWLARELANYARTLEAPAEQVAPAFVQRSVEQGLANELEWLTRGLTDPSWLSPLSGNTQVTPLCTSWSMQCVGDPFLYDHDADVAPVVFYDDGCARLSGRVWAPRGTAAGANLPGVVIENGSIQAPETLYWFMAEALARAGYVVLTFDPRGQGRSDFMTPTFELGSNFNSAVFWTGLVNAIDFFHSTPDEPYPHQSECAGSYPTAMAAVNPFHDRLDRGRLGLVGHSLGAAGVTVVQSYGAPDGTPWPGLLADENPVDVIVAWDALGTPGGSRFGAPPVVARVPAMGQTSEYGIGGTPLLEPPDPEGHKDAFDGWREAGLPVFQLTIQGSTHFEWSSIPTFPTTSWCPAIENGNCAGGWGRPMAEHHTLAWLDRWLKHDGEPGFDDADLRLLDDAGPQGAAKMSFYWRSARAYESRNGFAQDCDDIRAGCPAASVARAILGAGSSGRGCQATDGPADAWGVLVTLAAVLLRRLVPRADEPAASGR